MRGQDLEFFRETQVTARKFAFVCACSFKDAPFNLVVNFFLGEIEKKKKKTLGITNPELKNLSHLSHIEEQSRCDPLIISCAGMSCSFSQYKGVRVQASSEIALESSNATLQ